jgi:alkylated DNA repair protein alkB family protein 6
VNEYRPGEGIMPHEDGSAYEPVVATISLGGTVVLDLYAKPPEGIDDDAAIEQGERGSDGRPKPLFRILQEPGSLLITTGEAYSALLHGIAAVEVDEDLSPATVANWHLLGNNDDYRDSKNVRNTRTSLTYRDVLKVSKAGLGIFGKR